jgi:hypothetical protein
MKIEKEYLSFFSHFQKQKKNVFVLFKRETNLTTTLPLFTLLTLIFQNETKQKLLEEQLLCHARIALLAWKSLARRASTPVLVPFPKKGAGNGDGDQAMKQEIQTIHQNAMF